MLAHDVPVAPPRGRWTRSLFLVTRWPHWLNAEHAERAQRGLETLLLAISSSEFAAA